MPSVRQRFPKNAEQPFPAVPKCPTKPSPPAASNTSKEEMSHHRVSNLASEAEADENNFTANGHMHVRVRVPKEPGHGLGQVMISEPDKGHSFVKCDREERSYASWRCVTCSLRVGRRSLLPESLPLAPVQQRVFFTVARACACLGHLCIKKRRC